ncbi:MAG: peptidoglycan-binding domain-containing protein, partial [Bradyrhizobium sp.]|uniref:peptidoglycan-binding domain-containing protein n=1 Tax=Bradyrhizobium sp. TaxID=376 RepID=UPI00271E4A09
DPMTNLVKAITSPQATPSNIARPPAPIPAASRNETHQTPAARRVAAVQRTLTEYGYGQLKPTGIAGSDTQAAIQKFERERKLPVTGQVSDRLLRELTAMIGRPVD